MQEAIDLVAKACPRLEYIVRKFDEDFGVISSARGIIIRHQPGGIPRRVPRRQLRWVRPFGVRSWDTDDEELESGDNSDAEQGSEASDSS